MERQLIGDYVHLPGKPREKHALFMLRKIASLVKPIMLKHGYQVGTLSELSPTELAIVGLNCDKGREIKLRLRQPYDHSVFLDIESECIPTMLHELTHNEHSAHDQKFQNHLALLEREYAVLKASGYNGEGFYSPGHVLGAGIPKNPQLTNLRQQAVIAAEQKRRSIFEGSGQRLGSAGGMEHYWSLREAIARAAERRAMEEKTCGTGKSMRLGGAGGQGQEQSGIRTASGEDEDERRFIRQAVEMIEAMEREEVWPNRLGEFGTGGHGSDVADAGGAWAWACPRCTLINPEAYLQCSACCGLKPSPEAVTNGESSRRADAQNGPGTRAKGKAPVYAPPPPPPRRMWTCHMCGLWNDHEWWTCTSCGTMKLSS